MANSKHASASVAGRGMMKQTSPGGTGNPAWALHDSREHLGYGAQECSVRPPKIRRRSPMDYASPGLNGKSTSTISRNGKSLKVEATALLAEGWWPVAIYPPGIEREGHEATKGKEP